MGKTVAVTDHKRIKCILGLAMLWIMVQNEQGAAVSTVSLAVFVHLR